MPETKGSADETCWLWEAVGVRVVVVGGGIAGLTCSLLAARGGNDVIVLDRDPERRGDKPEDAWARWDRRSVPQFRQVHAFQALAHRVLAVRLPDVLAKLHAAGGYDAAVAAARPDAASIAGSEELVQFRCRRATLEWVLRRAALEERGVEVRDQSEVLGLATSSTAAPRVVGVRTSRGEVAADLVIDASGRRTPIGGWCAKAGLAAPEEVSIDTRQVYFTHWFRRRDPSAPFAPTRVELSCATVYAVPADSGWFAVTFFAPAGDAELRAVLLDPDRFAAAVRTVAPVAPLIEGEVADPHGGVLFMGRLSNHLRRWVADGPPAGLLALADAVVCTNPTWGRGVALAMANAAMLMDTLSETEDPATLAERFHRRALVQLEPWFHDTVELDQETNALWSQLPGPAASALRSGSRFSHAEALAATRVDPVVYVAYSRYRNLLDPPATFWADTDIAGRVESAVADGAPGVTLDSPTRADIVGVA
jgi:flavin-dependent dehydrogenase